MKKAMKCAQKRIHSKAQQSAIGSSLLNRKKPKHTHKKITYSPIVLGSMTTWRFNPKTQTREQISKTWCSKALGPGYGPISWSVLYTADESLTTSTRSYQLFHLSFQRLWIRRRRKNVWSWIYPTLLALVSAFPEADVAQINCRMRS